MNRSTFWMNKYMNGSVFSKARYMNGEGFEILARSPVPKLPLSYPPRYYVLKQSKIIIITIIIIIIIKTWVVEHLKSV